MKKGNFFNITAGILDILAAIGLFATIALYFVGINDLLAALYFPFLSYCSKIFELSLDLLEILKYVIIGILGLAGLLSLIFGSVTLARSRKEPAKYYNKGGRLIGYAIVETIILAFFTALLIEFSSIVSIVAVSLLGVIVLFRYIGLGRLFCGKKKYLAEMPAEN